MIKVKGIWFDNIHSYDNLNLILSSVSIPPATVKTNYIDIPGADGSIDLTEALGAVRYKPRSCSFVFSVFPYEDFEEKKKQISNLLNGKRCKILLDKDPAYYWLGRCSVNNYASDKNLHKITVNATVDPYKYRIDETAVDVELSSVDCISNAVGNPISIDDISPVEHPIGLKIGGMTRKCENLIPYPYLTDTNTTRESVTFTTNEDGTITLNGTAINGLYFSLNSCPVVIGEKYTFALVGAILGVTAYVMDDTDSYIYANSSNGYCVTFTAKKSTVQITMIVNRDTVLSNARIYPMLNEGTTALPHEPYFEGLRSYPATKVENVGKNRWNNEKAVFGEGALTRTETGFNFVRGDFAKGTSASYAIPLKKGQTVTFSCVGSKYPLSLYLYKEKAYGTNLMSVSDGLLTYTAQEDLPKATFAVIINSNNGDNEVSNIQVEFDKSATAYTPFAHNTLPIPQAVQALDGYGWGINESVYNYIDFEKKQFVKNVHAVTFNGTEGWIESGSTTDYKKYIVSVPFGTIAYSACVASFSGVNSTDVGELNYYVGGNFNVWTSKYTTVNDFTAYLAKNPLTVYYELAEPVITDISDLISGEGLKSIYPVSNLSTQEGAILDVTYLNTNYQAKTVVLNNGRKPVVPIVECSNDNTTIGFGSSKVTVNAGKHKILDLQLKEGENPVSITGIGTARFTYQEGDL